VETIFVFLIRVTSWIVLLSGKLRTIHEVTPTDTNPKLSCLDLDLTFEAKAQADAAEK